MNYNISVREFMHQKDSIDFSDFNAKFFEEVKKINEKTNCMITINSDMSGTGLPVSVKDCICTKGLLTTAGSKILSNYVPVFDASVVSNAKSHGCQIIGKTNMDEFGFGSFSVNSAFGAPKNPYDSERSCGGSSGGSGCITAAMKMPHVSIAESTGGSISCPASFCGVVGITPTYGLVSRYGLIDYANSLDKIGCMGKTVYDAALLLSIIAGHDKMDSTSLNEKQKDYTKYCDNDKKMKIGMSKEYFENINEDIKEKIIGAVKLLEDNGYEIVDVSLPHTKYAISSYYIIAMSEASTNLAKYCGMRYGLEKEMKGNFNEYFSDVRSDGFGSETKRRIILGTYARMAGYRDAFYLKAMKVRTLIIEDFKKAFRECDVLAAPTMPFYPPKFSEIEKLTPMEHYQSDILTVPANLAGIPHLSVPVPGKLPLGLHFMSDHLQEEKIISVGSQYEKLRGKIEYPKH